MAVSRNRLPAEARQAEIVQTVLRLAASTGPGDIKTADIAAALGLTQGALFRHFDTKEAIWLAVAEWARDTLLQTLAHAAAAEADPLAALAAVFRAHVAFVVAHPGVPRMIFHELQRPGDSPVKVVVRDLLQRYRELIAGILHKAQASGNLPAPLDVAAAMALFIGSIQGLVMQSLLAGSPQQMPSLAEGVLTLYFKAIGAQP